MKSKLTLHTFPVLVVPIHQDPWGVESIYLGRDETTMLGPSSRPRLFEILTCVRMVYYVNPLSFPIESFGWLSSLCTLCLSVALSIMMK